MTKAGRGGGTVALKRDFDPAVLSGLSARHALEAFRFRFQAENERQPLPQNAGMIAGQRETSAGDQAVAAAMYGRNGPWKGGEKIFFTLTIAGRQCIA